MSDPRPLLVLYAPADEAFVRGYFLAALGPPSDDEGNQLIDARDLATIEIAELEHALLATSVTIAVVSRAFLANPWSRLSELLVSSVAVERDLEMIPLVLESCPLPLHIRERVSLDFRFRAEWEDQARRVREHLARPAPVEASLPCPYPEMRPFEAKDAKYFRGRDAEIAAIVALVEAGKREIYVVGPSGSGKSSLISAGVLPALAAQPGASELILSKMRPGDAPLRRLAECLGATEVDEAAVAAWAACHRGARLVVFIDQLEELFTTAPASERAGFAAAVRALRAESRCLLVLAVRADFYAELIQSQLWLDGPRRHIDVLPLRGAALRAAIEQPARVLDVYLERDLVERLLADAAGEPGVLPLLQETLFQLWGRQRRRRLLTLTEYEALGEGGRSGLAVAISSRAERCMCELTAAQIVVARRLLLRLVSFGQGRPNTRRRQTRAQLASGETAAELDAVLGTLLASRLLTLDGDGRSGDDQVDLCHDVLITAWPSFAAWVETRRADEMRRRQIQASADEWSARGRGESGLLDEGELAAAIAWRKTDAARELGESDEVVALVDASRSAITRSRRRRRRAIGIVGIVLVQLAVAAIVAAFVANEKATEAEIGRRKVLRMLGEHYLELGRQAVHRGELQRAIPYLVAARRQGVDNPVLRAMFRVATKSSVALSLPHRDAVTSTSFSPDGTRIVTASRDGSARLWDATSGNPVTPPLHHGGPVRFAQVRADNARMLTIAEDNAAWVWDVAANPPSAVALPHGARVNSAVFSADGTMVVTASDDGTVQRWSVGEAEPRRLEPQLGHKGRVVTAALSRDGSRIVTIAQQSPAVTLWDAQSGAQIAVLVQDLERSAGSATGLAMPARAVRFSPDGTRVAVAIPDGTVLVFDAITGTTAARPLTHPDGLDDPVFAPDRTQLATISGDHRVRIWDVARSVVVGHPFEHPTEVTHIAFSADGTRLVSAGKDKRVRVWEVANGGRRLAVLELGARDMAISPDGTRVITGSDDGFARIWTIGDVAQRVFGLGPQYSDAVYSPDGRHIVAIESTGFAHLWPTSGEDRRELPGLIAGAAFDRDGLHVALMNHGGTLIVRLDAPGEAMQVPPPRLEELPEPEAPAMRRRYEVPRVFAPGSFSPDGSRFAMTSVQRSARVWEVASGRPVTPWLTHELVVFTVHFSPDGSRVVTASADGTARVWDARTGEPIGPPLVHPANVWVDFAAFTPDARYIVTIGDDHHVRLWDAASRQLEVLLTGHTERIHTAQFSQDGVLLLTADRMGVRIWRIATGALAVPPLEHCGRVVCAQFSPDASRVVTAADGVVQLWDVSSGRQLGPPLEHRYGLGCAMFSPDGKSVLTAGGDALRIWDAALDHRTLDDWQRIADRASYPDHPAALVRAAP
jgi:WD40 repeat protein